MLMSALLVGGASTFVSCKDYDGDQVAELNAGVADLRGIIKGKSDTLKIIRDNLDPNLDGALYKSVDSFLKGLDLEISSDVEKLNKINDFAVELKALVGFKDYIKELKGNEDFKSMVSSAGKVNSFIQNLETAGWGENFENLVTVEKLNEALDSLSRCQCDLSQFLKSDELLEKAVAAGLIKKSEVESMLNGYYTKDKIDSLLAEKVTADNITTAINALRTEIDDKLADKLDNATFEDFKTAYTENFDALVDSVGDLSGRVATLEKMAEQMTTLAGVITNINNLVGENATNIATNSALIAANTANINTLTTRVDQLENRLDNFVTGITVDKVHNPIFGSLNLPFGVKSTVLCGIYGSRLQNVVFPLAGEDDGGYVFEDQANWTLASDAQPITFKDEIAQSTVGGNICLSIQPNNVKAAGKAVTLISRDRANYAPGYSLAFLQNDNSKITTRSAAGGTYVAQAKITNPSAAKVNIDKQELADAARDVWNSVKDKKFFDVPSLAKTIYSTFKNVIPEYYAVDYAWMDGDQEKHVWSDYEIAAVTIKPLSFETLVGRGATLNKSIPQLEEILGINLSDYQFTWENLKHLDPMKKYITVTIPNTEGATINGIPAPSVKIDDSKLEVIKTEDYLKDDNGNYILDKDGNKIKTIVDVKVNILEGLVKVGEIDLSNATIVLGPDKEEEFEVVIEMDEFNDMIDEINNNVGGMLGNVNDLLDKVQDGFDKINNGIIARLNNVIAKVNKITENPNNLLQPVMIYRDAANGTGRLSESSIAPTRLNLGGASSGSIAMYPTSYTAELLAPAYKKYVQVTPLDGGTASFSKRMFGAGHESTIFTATAGKYEIVYAAIDFYGKRVAKKYYVEVK